ncbi:YhgE/Pip domain-containing protein [Cryobacterium melibiosiphilum]|uniref:YhgE/Pip domain-containing protein n=1 Tax=Cryobacterium melibiosiphilum TaxID=995039 RepID=A0A3A5ML29_9MICO|nr:YhgE/Pip domain-containing protein [Cryobacterium melibiosiphilum]RJT85167.1 YhgE/Pip domain-containing protein [Cryobacterium melibiosiphilum]
MPVFSLPRIELSRFRVTRLTKAALVVIAVLPALYGGLYLSSTWSPTDNLDQLTAAVVNNDEPVTTDAAPGTTTQPGTLAAGADLADTLTGSSSDAGFTWVETDAAAARVGLDDGTFAATIVVPADFSAHLASMGSDSPEQALLTVTTNDADNYIVGQVSNSIAATLRQQVQGGATDSYLDQIYLAFSAVHDDLTTAGSGATDLSTGAATAHDGSTTLATGLDQLAAGSGDVATGSTDLTAGATTLESGTAELSAGLGTLTSATAGLTEQTGALEAGAASAQSGSSTLATGADALTTGLGTAQTGAGTLASGAAAVATGSAALATGTGALATGADTLSTASRTVSDAAAALLSSYETLSDGQRRALLQQLAAGANTTADGAEALTTNAAVAADGAARVATGASGVSTGAATLSAAFTPLTEGATALATGAHTVATGLGTLSAGTQALAEATPELRAGIVNAAAGADGVGAGAASVSAGAGSLATATTSLAAGTATADAGANDLETGLGTLATGTATLADGLTAGAEAVPSYTGAQRAALTDVGSNPIAVDRVHENAVDAYGEGMAPYFIPLSLWIGGIVTFMILRALSPRALASTARSWRVALAGFAPGALFGVVQALVLMAVLIGFVGLESPHLPAVIAFTVLVAIVFTAVHQSLVALLGGAGRLVALILLMLQLTSSGGTYPVGVSPAFFQAISPFLPMSYAVSGLRHLIAGGGVEYAWAAAAHLVLFLGIALGLSIMAAHRNRFWSVARLHPSLAI